MNKKVFSLFLAIVMLMSLMVMPASAKVIAGKYGSISWRFDDSNGLLTISGNGYVKNNYWQRVSDAVTEVVIEEGITGLGTEVLSKHYSLETVHLPLSLEEIGMSVFLHSPVSRIIYAGTEDDWYNNVYIDYWIEYNPVFDDMDAFTFLGDEGGTGDDEEGEDDEEEDIRIEYYYDLPNYTTEQFVSISLPTQVTAVTEAGDELTLFFTCPAVDFSVAGEHRIQAYGNIPEGYYMDGCEDGIFEVQFSVFVNPAPQGVCGANLSWMIRNGVLEITGSGDMYDYDNDIEGREIPWKNYAGSITQLSLPSAMSSISKDFIAGTQVSNVYLPASVSEIADGAFRNATKLSYVSGNNYFVRETNGSAIYTADMKTLVVYAYKIGVSTSYYVPIGVEEIAPYAFQNTKVQTVFVPSSVTEIGNKAFSAENTLVGHKNGVTEQYATANGNTFVPTYVYYVKTPADVTVMQGERAEVPTETVGTLTTKEQVPVYLSYEGEILTDKVGTMTVFPNLSVSGDWEIRDSVSFRVIVETPHYEGTSNTVSWFLQDGVLTLSGSGYMADEIPWANYMDEIKSVSIGSNIAYIPQGAFAGMNLEGISSHSLSYPVVNGVLFHENTLFCYPAKLPGADYVVADDVTKIAKQAFRNATNLETVTVKKTVDEIGEDAFLGTNLKLIVDGQSEAHSYAKENGLAFELLPAEIIETGTYNGFTYAVDVNYHMTVSGTGYVEKNYRLRPDCYEMIRSITFEEGITGLDTYITYFENVEEINFPASAFALYAFVDIDCPNLKRVTVTPGNERFYTVDGVMFQHTQHAMVYYPSAKTDKVYTIPEDCQWIYAPFAGSCRYLEELRFGTNVKAIDNNIGNCTSLKRIVVDADSDFYTSIDGVLYDKTMYYLVQFPVAHPAQSFTVPSAVKVIENSAFKGAKNPETIVMSDSVIEIENDAFYQCPNLKYVTLSDNLKYIYSETFYQCGALEQINLPSSLQIVYSHAFYECENLTGALHFPSGMTLIDDNAFMSTNITAVSIPSGVEIGRYAFEDCGAMQTLSLAEGITTVGYGAFMGCSSLKELVIPSTMVELDNYLFAGCSSLETLVISEGVRSIGNSNFSGCSSLVSVSLPDSLEEIGSSAFYQCSSLESISIPEKVTEIPYEAFEKCSSLTDIALPENLEIIGSCAFYSCTALESIRIPEKVHTIDRYAFYNCTALTSVTLPDSVQTIGDSAFYKCSALQSVNIPDGVTTILYNTFRNCTSLKEIVLPETVTSIDTNAFNGCTALEKIVIPESVTTIASNAFTGCANLTIYGKVGSYAQTYADSKNIPFVGMEKTILSVGDSWKELSGAELFVGDDYKFPDGVACTIEGEADTVVFDIVYDGVLDTSYAHTQTITATLVIPEGYNLANGIVTEKVLTFYITYPYASGKLDNISWTVADGVLTVSGQGNIPDFQYDEEWGNVSAPWYRYAEFIYGIVIEPGITGIGDNAFRYLRLANSISIPEGVTYLGVSAFEGASSDAKGLKLTLPSTLTELGVGALENMSVREITLPKGITYLPDDLFYKSPYLTTVTIEGKLTNIGECAFYGCPIQTVYFAGTIAEWNRISIAEKGNEDFIGAELYCNEPIDVPLDEPVVDHKIDYNTNTASIVVDVPKSAIAASPNGTGEIIAIGIGANGFSVQDSTPIKDIGSHDLSVNTKDVQEVKIFIWDSLESMRPIALPVTVKVPAAAGGAGK